MITINPSDFGSDALYTKMEELNAKQNTISPLLEMMQKDFNATTKYLKELKLLGKNQYWIEVGDGQDEDWFEFGWDNEEKRFVMRMIDIRGCEQKIRPLLECKLTVRIACHTKLSRLIDLIIRRTGENYDQ